MGDIDLYLPNGPPRLVRVAPTDIVRRRSASLCYSACKIDPHMRGIGVEN